MGSTTQYPSPDQPFAIKQINRLGRGLSAVGFSKPRLSPDRLIAKACQKSGLSNFGDESFRLGLDKLCESFEHEAKLSQIGRIAARQLLLDNLALRLQIVEYRKQHPEVAKQTIERPLFVLGLPRTGTTILYELLAQDPAHRSPASWEVLSPFPPARQESFTTDPRIKAAEEHLNKIEILAPGFKAIHEIGARLPQECVSLLAAHFISDQFGASYSIPEYRRWSLNQDMTATYQWHYQFLQHLQADYRKTRWVLKTPAHLPYLDTIIKQYPDAALVHTHRDPVDVMGSISSLACTLHSAFSDKIDPMATGRREAEFFSTTLNKSIALRDAMPDADKRFFDVQFDDIVADPIKVIESIYQHFDFPFTPEARAAMQHYLDNRPRDKHGRHHYKLEDYGLSRDELGVLFGDYCQRFGMD
ncbi:MAG: hypothetical protein ACI9JM_002109 [Halioglobus sp.]|jgi:hypothetical protein